MLTMGRTRKGRVNVSKEDGTKRTAVIVLRTTKDERNARRQGQGCRFNSLQDALDAFIATASSSGTVTKAEQDYTTKPTRADGVAKKMKLKMIGGKPVLAS